MLPGRTGRPHARRHLPEHLVEQAQHVLIHRLAQSFLRPEVMQHQAG
jgi:hypothetical protein